MNRFKERICILFLFIVWFIANLGTASFEDPSKPYGPGFIPQTGMSMLQLVNQARAYARVPPVCISQ